MGAGSCLWGLGSPGMVWCLIPSQLLPVSPQGKLGVPGLPGYPGRQGPKVILYPICAPSLLPFSDH